MNIRLLILLRSKQGSFLVFTIWVLGLLAVFSLGIGYQVRQRLRYIQTIEYRQILRHTADAGVKKAGYVIKKSASGRIADNGLFSEWANNVGEFREVEVGQGVFSVRYRLPGEEEERYGVVDEESKLNLNTAEAKVLARLIEIVTQRSSGFAGELAAALIDWRDEDDFLGPGGAESRYYRALEPPYSAKNKDFEVLEEMMLVKGMTPELYEQLSPYFTVKTRAKININTVPLEILSAYGLGKGSVDAIGLYRVGRDKKIGTADDRFFESTGSIVDDVSQVTRIATKEQIEIKQLVDKKIFSTASQLYQAQVDARIKNRKEALLKTCFLKRSGEVIDCQESFYRKKEDNTEKEKL